MKGRIETLPPVEINIVKDHKENAALLFHPYFIYFPPTFKRMGDNFQ